MESNAVERISCSQEQLRLFEDQNTRMGNFLDKNWGRLDEALYRIEVELEDHGFHEIAQYDLGRLREEAMEMGIEEDTFRLVCQWVQENPWIDEETGERWIETPEGHGWYNGIPTAIYGPGSFPPGASMEVLKMITPPTPQVYLN